MKIKFWLSLIACSLALSVSLGQNAHADGTTFTRSFALPTPAELNHRKELWQEALTKISKKENTPLIVKVNPTDQIANTNYLIPSGALAMEALQRAIKLRWEQVDGVQVFTHPWKANAIEDKLTVADWIDSLPPDQQATLFEKGIPLATLDEKTQDAMLDLLNRPDMPVGLDLPFALLDTKDQARVFLRFIPRFKFQFASHGKTVTGTVIAAGQDETRSTFGQPFAYERNALVKFPPLLPASKPSLLTFTGEIVSLNDIVARAAAAFHDNYPVDQAQGETLYFISGSLDKTTFENVLAVLKSPNGVPSPEPPTLQEKQILTSLSSTLLKSEYAGLDGQIVSVGWTHLIPRPFDRAHMKPGTNPGVMPNGETIPMKKFLDETATNVGQLTQDRPWLRSFLNIFGVSSETPISLQASLTLFVASPGMHFMGESDATNGGESVPMAEFNIGSFDLQD